MRNLEENQNVTYSVRTTLENSADKNVENSVDKNVENSADKNVEISADKNVEISAELKVWFPYFTKPIATMSAACFSLLFFWYRISDKILSKIHNSKHLFCLVGLAIICLTILVPRWGIISETLAIILMAAYVYPNKRPLEQPKGQKGIPKHHRQKTDRLYRQAA